MSSKSGTAGNDVSAEWRAREICKDLSPRAMSKLESFAMQARCESTTLLFAEEQKPRSILFLIGGE